VVAVLQHPATSDFDIGASQGERLGDENDEMKGQASRSEMKARRQSQSQLG
jgi:hypothetical protein